MRGASTNSDLVVCQPASATICSAVAMLMVNALCSMMLAVVSQAQLLVVADTAPGRVHGVGDAILVIGRQDKCRLGIGSGFETKIFAHIDFYYFLCDFGIPLPVVPVSGSGGMLV